jgi:hypothetical protein
MKTLESGFRQQQPKSKDLGCWVQQKLSILLAVDAIPIERVSGEIPC